MALDGALEGQSLHLFGINGRGMAPLALVAQRLGAHVSGCDHTPFGDRLDELTRAGIPVATAHDVAHIAEMTASRAHDWSAGSAGMGAALVATSIAPASNPEVALAASRGILHHRTDLLAACLRTRPGVGVTGSHGKGTVTALTAAALIEAGLDPLTLIGVDAPGAGGIARPGAGPLVAEVDNSDMTLRGVSCQVAVVTTLRQDHPELPFSLRDSVHSVGDFVSRARRRVIIGPTPQAAELAGRATAPVWRFGQDLKGRLLTAEAGRSVIAVSVQGVRQEVELNLLTPNAHANAALALAAAISLGADPAAAAEGLSRVDRIYRRLQPLGQPGGVHVYDDLGGVHPHCVRAGIVALRRHFPEARLTACFEPYALYERAWGDRYARALSTADRVVLAPTPPLPGASHEPGPSKPWWIASRAPVTLTGSREDASVEAMAGARPGDVVVFFAQDDHARSMAIAAAGGHAPALRPADAPREIELRASLTRPAAQPVLEMADR